MILTSLKGIFYRKLRREEMVINDTEQYFKEIVDRRGYLVESEDRQVFEKEISKSNLVLDVKLI